MAKDLRQKLKRLGVQKGTHHLKPAEPVHHKRKLIVPPISPEPVTIPESQEAPPQLSLSQIFPKGYIAKNSHGACFIVDQHYPMSYQHGRFPLSHLDKRYLHTIQDIDSTIAWPKNSSLETILFIDTETTGLRGAGTIPFMIGVAFIDGQTVTVRQFFLRNHADESAALFFLAQLVDQRPNLVTFNGRSFDIPVLDGRLFMNRIELSRGELGNHAHLDLLLLSRRLWRERFPSCALGALENNVLGIQRTHDDVPSHFIPVIYNDYLHSGDPSRISNVFYHNHIDMISMITLMGQVLHLLSDPEKSAHPLELLGLAKWLVRQKRYSEAETILNAALKQNPPPAPAQIIMDVLAGLLKKQDRRAEARPYWEKIAQAGASQHPSSILACIELAKFYEWHDVDLENAAKWTTLAYDIAQKSDPYNRPLHSELKHRKTRITSKQKV